MPLQTKRQVLNAIPCQQPVRPALADRLTLRFLFCREQLMNGSRIKSSSRSDPTVRPTVHGSRTTAYHRLPTAVWNLTRGRLGGRRSSPERFRAVTSATSGRRHVEVFNTPLRVASVDETLREGQNCRPHCDVRRNQRIRNNSFDYFDADFRQPDESYASSVMTSSSAPCDGRNRSCPICASGCSSRFSSSVKLGVSVLT